MKLRTAILFVKDLPTMTRFYRDVLGLPHLPERSAPGWEEFGSGNIPAPGMRSADPIDADGAILALHAIPWEFARDMVIADPPTPRTETPIKLVFAVDDVMAERARLVAAGVTMGDLRPWDACDGLDPEGNVFQIARF